ncbi:glutamate receptor 2.8-like protein [Tanacetum coccineum]
MILEQSYGPVTRLLVQKVGKCQPIMKANVFNAVIGALPYAVKTEFIPFVTSDGKQDPGTYNDLLHNLSNGKFDAVAGDITILANRSKYVDFTLPYTEAGFSMIVPIKVDDRKSPWIFMRPLETNLWITIGAFFIYTGLVVWVVEHRVNKEFRRPPGQQVGMIFWFSFSTLVFAHRLYSLPCSGHKIDEKINIDNFSANSVYGYIAIAIDLLLREVYSQSVQPEQTTSGEDKTLK